MQIGLGNLNVVAEDLIEANLQRVDVGAFALALLHRCDDLFAVLAQVAKFIQLRVVTVANHSGISRKRRRLIGNRAFEALANIGEFIDFLMKLPKQFAAPGGRRRKKILQHRKLHERFTKRHKFARSRQAQGDAARKPLEVLDAFEFLAKFAADHSLLDEVCNGAEARLDGFSLNQWTQNPG